MPNLFYVLGLPVLGLLAALLAGTSAWLLIGAIVETAPMRRWIRRRAVRISVVALVAVGLFTGGGTAYAFIAGNPDPTIKIALIGDVLAGGAGLLALVAGGIAAATYSLAVSPPRLRVRLQYRQSPPILLQPTAPNEARNEAVTLSIPCRTPSGGLHQLVVDPMLKNVLVYLTLVNEVDVLATNVLCQAELSRVTGTFSSQKGWTMIPPAGDAARVFFWEGEPDRSVVGNAERPLPPLDLAGASITGASAIFSVYVQADRFARATFCLLLEPESGK